MNIQQLLNSPDLVGLTAVYSDGKTFRDVHLDINQPPPVEVPHGVVLYFPNKVHIFTRSDATTIELQEHLAQVAKQFFETLGQTPTYHYHAL